MPPIFMGPMQPGPQVIQQNLTIKQSGGGFGQFLMGLFGGLSRTMPGAYPMGYYNPMYPCSVFPYAGGSMPYSYYMQQAQMSQLQMQQNAMINQMQQQMSPYGYLNQQQQQFPQLTNQGSAPSTEMQNLETFFKDKGYIICPEADGNFTVADKDGKLLASGSYEEVRDKLFEINQEEIEDREDIESEGDDDSDIDEDSPAVRSQSIPSGWYKSSNDKYPYLKSVDVAAVNREAKKEGQSAARYIVSHLFLGSRLSGCLSMNQINELTKDVLARNRDCFNEDGSFKEGFSADNLALPSTTWVMKNLVGKEGMSPSQLHSLVQKRMSNQNPYFKGKEHEGNIQFHANLMAQNNYYETNIKNVYYNPETKTCVYYFYDDNNINKVGKAVLLPGIKVNPATLYKKGVEIGKGYKVAADESKILELAEERHEISGSSKTKKEKENVPDDDGMSDNTVVFEEDDD